MATEQIVRLLRAALATTKLLNCPTHASLHLMNANWPMNKVTAVKVSQIIVDVRLRRHGRPASRCCTTSGSSLWRRRRVPTPIIIVFFTVLRRLGLRWGARRPRSCSLRSWRCPAHRDCGSHRLNDVLRRLWCRLWCSIGGACCALRPRLGLRGGAPRFHDSGTRTALLLQLVPRLLQKCERREVRERRSSVLHPRGVVMAHRTRGVDADRVGARSHFVPSLATS